jgi:hypothetical protein
MQTTFPLTILLKNGKLQVISMLPPDLTAPLLKRVLQELEVSPTDRYSELEAETEEDGKLSPLFHAFQQIDADAICLLTGDGEFIFLLSPMYEIDETANYQLLMREKLEEYLGREGNHD